MLGRCNPESANGIDKAVYHVSSAQAALGNAVSVFSVSPKPVIPVPGVQVHTYPPATVLNLPRRALQRDLLSWRPDVVHIHSLYVPANAVIAQVLRRSGVPYVITPYGAADQHLMMRRSYVKRPYRALVERPTLNRAAFVHAIDDERSIFDYGVTSPVVSAPSGIDFAAVPEALDRNTCRTSVGVSKHTRLAVFIGRLDPVQKGLDILIDAFAGVATQMPELILLLVGPDHHNSRRALSDLTVRRGLSSRVIIREAAFGQAKFELLGAADFAVHPSRWEAMPFSVLEALAAGRPCLVSHAADPAGLIARHEAGVVVEPTIGAVARALDQLGSASNDELTRMGRHAFRLARAEFSWPRVAQTLVDGYARHATRTHS